MPFGTVTLNDGNKLPVLAFGTGSVFKGRDVVAYVEQAIECGFSHIDTAAVYRNEDKVGQAIRESGLDRSELYITSKYGGGNIREAIQTSLARLGIKQLDLYLIHAPIFIGDGYETAWKEFENLKDTGLTRSIGVSNFNLQHLQRLLKTATVVPAVNQILFHPYNYAENKPLLEYASKHGIVIEAYSSLSPITKYPGGPVDKPLRVAAERLGATPTQVILAWARSKGVAIVTTSSKKEHLLEYLAVADLPSLTDQEIEAIDRAGAVGPPGVTRWSIMRGAAIGLGLCLYTLYKLALHDWSI